MQVLRLPPRHHPRAEISCPPLRWRAVRRRLLKAGALALVSGGGLVALVRFAGPEAWRQPLTVTAGVVLLGVLVACLLRLAHVAHAASEPLVFKVARGELSVTWPFLFSRRTRTVRTSDVTAVVVNVPSREAPAGRPVARMVIRRRHRRAIRVPGARPVHDLNHAAEELRAALRV